jgi:hypothetical protein
MKNLTRWKIIMALLLSLVTGHWSPAFGQFIGYTAQQVATKSFSVSGGAPTPKTIIPLPNFGQAAHTVQVVYGNAAANCTVWLQVSTDNSNWFTLVMIPNISGANPYEPSATQVGYGNGYFPFLRLIANANDAVGCTTSIAGIYTGYQHPIPWQATVYNAPHADIKAPVTLTDLIEYPAGQILTGWTCTNPNASTAYLQIADKNPPPAGAGSFLLYVLGIPAGKTVSDSVAIYSGNGLSASASTTPTGNTPVTSPLVCNFQLNLNGPFGPFLGMPNRL